MAITSTVPSAASVGAYSSEIATAKDSNAGDNLVNTDVSVLDCIIIG